MTRKVQHRLLFVAATTSIVSAYCWFVGRVLPPLRNEPASLLLLPMTAISAVMAAAISTTWPDRRTCSEQARRLYLGFLASLILYGLYLWWFISDGGIGLILLALLAGHLYGLPAFLAILSVEVAIGRMPLVGDPGSRV